MSSSSTRSTFLELHLHCQFKLCFTRLHSSDYESQAEVVLYKFAEVLDIEPRQLYRSIKPSYDPDYKTPEQHKADVKAWKTLYEENVRLVRSRKVYDAGSALADAAAALNAVRRSAEANLFCEWADELWRLAIEEEDREKRSKVYYADQMVY